MVMGQTPTPGRIVLVRVNPVDNAGADELPGIITGVDKDGTVSVSVFSATGALTALSDVTLYDTREDLDAGLSEHIALLPPRPPLDAHLGPYSATDVLPWVNAARWPSVPASTPPAAPPAAPPVSPVSPAPAIA
jgi:hypothetical protein